jgi:RNA polymerase sigma factor (sigma-70 family)
MGHAGANPRKDVRAQAATGAVTGAPLGAPPVFPVVPVSTPQMTAGAASDGESTVELTRRAQAGDLAALESLCVRCMRSLTRYAAGRLPVSVRDMLDTQDVVIEAVHRGLVHLDHFEARHPGALLAYMRTTLRNLIVDYVRSRIKQPPKVSLNDQHADAGQSPLERVLGEEQVAIYEAALARLRPRDAALVTLKIEEHISYAEIATALGFTSSNSARVAARRAVLRLAHEMARLSQAKSPHGDSSVPPASMKDAS